MAITATEVFKTSGQNGRRMHVYNLAFDDAYPTGGEAVTADQVGLGRIDEAFIPPAGGFTFEWDQANSKVLAYWVDTTVDGAAMAQVTDTTDINANLTAVLGVFFGV
jgi:hypothetical protein